MPFEVKFEDETIAKGQAVIVDGIGEFANGETRTVTDEENELFEIFYGQGVQEAFKSNERFTVTKVAVTKVAAKKPVDEGTK